MVVRRERDASAGDGESEDMAADFFAKMKAKLEIDEDPKPALPAMHNGVLYRGDER